MPYSDDKCCTLYLVRHGDSRQDKLKRYIGQCDPPLNPRGRAQARFLRLQLADIDLHRVYCSDLRRCRETARIVAGGRGLRVRSLRALREIALGRWEGLPVAEVQRRFPGEYERRGKAMMTYRPPDGESFSDLQARVVPAFLDILSRESGHVLMVGHAGVNRAILCHLQKRPLAELFRIPQTYAGLNIIQRHGDSIVVRAVNIPPELSGWSSLAEVPLGSRAGW